MPGAFRSLSLSAPVPMREQFLWIVHILTVAARYLYRPVESERRIEIGQRLAVALCREAARIDFAGVTLHGAPHLIVEHNCEDRKLLGGGNVMRWHRIAEHVGAIADAQLKSSNTPTRATRRD